MKDADLSRVFEDSPWVAERTGPSSRFSSLHALWTAMCAVVEAASREERLALLRAHPDLGTRARIGESSAREQAGAGLNQLTSEEFEKLSRLNAEYKEKFGFPFLYAVKGSDKYQILNALEKRLTESPEAEFEEALRQVFRIARFRLEEIFA